MSPKNFLQVYFIRAELGVTSSVLCASSFLQRKNAECYRELFNMIVDKCEEKFNYLPSPEIAMMDFEQEAIRQLQEALGPESEVKGKNHLPRSNLVFNFTFFCQSPSQIPKGFD